MTATQIPYQGIWPALLTPLTAELAIDIPAFARHACSLLAAGCTGVTPFGTTGEGPSFSVAERIAAVDGLIAGGVPAGRILVSTSCAALPDVVALTRHAVQAGAFGCLMLPPFFLKGVPDQGVIDAYRWVIDQVADPRLRIVLYHIPQVSGVALSHTVVETLCRISKQIDWLRVEMRAVGTWTEVMDPLNTLKSVSTDATYAKKAELFERLNSLTRGESEAWRKRPEGQL